MGRQLTRVAGITCLASPRSAGAARLGRIDASGPAARTAQQSPSAVTGRTRLKATARQTRCRGRPEASAPEVPPGSRQPLGHDQCHPQEQVKGHLTKGQCLSLWDGRRGPLQAVRIARSFSRVRDVLGNHVACRSDPGRTTWARSGRPPPACRTTIGDRLERQGDRGVAEAAVRSALPNWAIRSVRRRRRAKISADCPAEPPSTPRCRRWRLSWLALALLRPTRFRRGTGAGPAPTQALDRNSGNALSPGPPRPRLATLAAATSFQGFGVDQDPVANIDEDDDQGCRGHDFGTLFKVARSNVRREAPPSRSAD